jgi:hypothetical protein
MNMPNSPTYYKVNEFIKLNQTGELDFDGSIQLVKEMVNASYFNSKSNILLDLRDTTLNNITFSDLLKIALELSIHQSLKTKKIANLVPDQKARLQTAEQFKLALAVSGFDYDFFTDIDDALKWLSNSA